MRFNLNDFAFFMAGALAMLVILYMIGHAYPG